MNVRRLLWILVFIQSLFVAPFLIITSILNRLGLGYRRKFRLFNTTIVRPKEYTDKFRKVAFERVGKWIEYHRKSVVRMEDIEFARRYTQESLNIPLEIWREVLEYFKKQGVVESRWRLKIPVTQNPAVIDDPDYNPEIQSHIPTHYADGSPIPNLNSPGWQTCVPDNPAVLTEEAKQDLLGKPYKLQTNGNFIRYKPDSTPDDFVIIAEHHFRHIYFRPAPEDDRAQGQR